MQSISQSPLIRRQAYIGGVWKTANDGRVFPVINPATGETLAQVADCGPDETREAIAAASAALPARRRPNAPDYSYSGTT